MTNVLAGLMLVAGIFMSGRVRVRSLLRLFAFQSLLLAGIAACSALAGNHHLLISAALVFLLKTVAIPMFMIRVMSQSGQAERLQPVFRPTISIFLSLLLSIAAFFLTFPLAGVFAENFFIVSVSAALVILGLFMLMSKKGLYGQIIGFLMMENGVFALGLALTGGMPLLVEVGVFFDVTVGAVLMALLSYRVHVDARRNDTDSLETLIE
jgi:hydrogenase-4 component E